jgi:hypothetical protein
MRFKGTARLMVSPAPPRQHPRIKALPVGDHEDAPTRRPWLRRRDEIWMNGLLRYILLTDDTTPKVTELTSSPSIDPQW